MTNSLHQAFKTPLGRVLFNSLIVSTIATAGLLVKLAPSSAGRPPTLTVTTAPFYAQSYSNDEITNYARAVLEIEPVRRDALGKIKQFINNEGASRLSEVACNNIKVSPWLPDEPRQIVVNYCEQSKGIVERHGLSVPRFNEITVNLRNNDRLKQRIRNELVRLQKGNG